MSDPSPSTPENSGWSRTRRVIFYASLALNLLVVGVVIGAVLTGGRPSARAPLDSAVPMVRALSPEQRAEVVTRMRTVSPDRSERPVTMMRRTREVLQVLRSDTFDPVRFDALLAEQGAATARRAATGRAALVEILSGMSAADRRAYVDRLEERLRRSVRDRRAGSGKDDPPR
jgi:uncharacterized membrane protein